MLICGIVKFGIFWSFDILLNPLSLISKNNWFRGDISSIDKLLRRSEINLRSNWCSLNCLNFLTSDYWLIVESSSWLSSNCTDPWSLINNIWCIVIDGRCDNFSSNLTNVWISISIVVLIGIWNWLRIVSSVKLSFISFSLSSIKTDLLIWLSSKNSWCVVCGWLNNWNSLILSCISSKILFIVKLLLTLIGISWCTETDCWFWWHWIDWRS